MDIENLINEVCVLAREVGKFQLEEISNVSSEHIIEKELNSLVSFVDKESEKILVAGLRDLLPSAGFITEEDTVVDEAKEYTWIIDPLDGTTNYLNRIPHFAISIALMYNDTLLAGVVHDPSMDECFHAIKDKGAFLNDKRIHVSKKKDLKNAIIVTGFPYTNTYDIEAYMRIVKYWLRNTRGIRRLGSAALDLAYVASGRLDAYYEATLNKWDLAAGALIVEEANGVVTDLDGKADFLSKGSIIATSADLFEQVFEPIQNSLSRVIEN